MDFFVESGDRQPRSDFRFVIYGKNHSLWSIGYIDDKNIRKLLKGLTNKSQEIHDYFDLVKLTEQDLQ